jgi:hypothetical protein
MPRWPLFLIAAPAAVAVWSGWVGLGGMCGFGVIHPLPGIWDSLRLNTAITLPVGVESYGAYALGAWLMPGAPATARVFARRSAIAALALGMAGQVAFHLLSAAHRTRAPWWVVMLVSCLPVVTLAFGAALTHLLRAPVPEPAPVVLAAPAPVPGTASAPVPGERAVPESAPAPRSAPGVPAPAGLDVLTTFAADLDAGQAPSIRRIRSELHIGQDKAREVQAYLRTLIPADGATLAAVAS